MVSRLLFYGFFLQQNINYLLATEEAIDNVPVIKYNIYEK